MLKQTHEKKLQFLDGLRGLAALYVMIGHARWLLWEGYSEGFRLHPQNYSVFNKALMYFFSLFKYGHEAVLFFFVLSGFVIHLRYARRMAEQGMAAKFDWAAFIWRRARRLYPPLLVAMTLGIPFGYHRQSPWVRYLSSGHTVSGHQSKCHLTS